MAYAEKTKVPISRSKAEVERILTKAGAEEYVTGRKLGMARVQCKLDDRILQFTVYTPKAEDLGRRFRTVVQTDNAIEQEERRRWRALVLIIKAKLELIENGQSTVEREFLADVLLPNKQTVGDWMHDQLEAAYSSRQMPKLLMPGS